MGQTQGREQEKAAFLRAAEAMYEELQTWRAQHGEASLDEIAAQVTPRRRALMGQLLKQLAQAGDERVMAPVCEECGVPMRYKGTPARGVSHGEGEVRLERAYYYCETCRGTFFPPGPPRPVGSRADQAPVESADDPAGAAAGGGDRLV